VKAKGAIILLKNGRNVLSI